MMRVSDNSRTLGLARERPGGKSDIQPKWSRDRDSLFPNQKPGILSRAHRQRYRLP